MCRVMFRSSFVYDRDRAAAVMGLDEREVIRDGGLLVRSMIVLAAVMVGFVSHSALQVEPSLVALLGAGALVAVSKLQPDEYLEEVEWPTLVFFVGLFIMVGALVEVGVVERLGESVSEAVDDPYFLAASVLLWGSALLSGIIDNIPYERRCRRSSKGWSRARAAKARKQPACGGPSQPARTLAATQPRSEPAPTWSSSASLPATATTSRSGSSPSTA